LRFISFGLQKNTYYKNSTSLEICPCFSGNLLEQNNIGQQLIVSLTLCRINTSRAKNLCHFPSIIYVCLEASETLFRVIFASELPDAGAMLFILAKLFEG